MGQWAADSPSAANRDWAEQVARQYRRALAESIDDDPDMSGLRPAAFRAGNHLVDVLGDLLHGRSRLVDVPGATTAERQDQFVARFVASVGGDGGLVGDAVARRAARRTAEKLLDADSPVDTALRAGDGSVRLPGDLFCSIYRFFFGELVGGYVGTVIAEGLPLAMALAVPFDPTGLVASRVTAQVLGALPDPCTDAASRTPSQGLLVETARELLTQTVDTALGIREVQP
ncbi:hypothetical protein [Micromonospora parathelypteridis]|uniref:Uncharacterized protein n=1 Tax=Micromonospora parathelypteridis TaxID=1839617 RepID=A0A840VS37_9ACTN|nr:hypothetical protein [Micromonospora parathelypteridis]MBB5479515.1 hypothetical protein [Micromonospora parathelypteridis]